VNEDLIDKIGKIIGRVQPRGPYCEAAREIIALVLSAVRDGRLDEPLKEEEK